MDLPGYSYLMPAFAAHAVAALTMAFVPPKDTGTRITAVVAIAAFCFRAIAGADRKTDEGQNHAEYMFGFMLHANCFLVLLALGAPKTDTAWWQRLRWSVAALFTPRIKLPKDTEHRPQLSARVSFATRRLLKALGLALVYIAISLAGERLPIWASDSHPEKGSLITQLYLRTLTQRHLIVRAGMAFMSITLPALFLSACHSLFSALAVLLLGSDPADWPPLFGNILDAWSVERWYSHFWEKLMRKAFTINASYLVWHLFELDPGSTAGRNWIVMLSFAMSGIMHTVSGWTGGRCASFMPMWTYLATGAIVLAERGLQMLYARHVHSRQGLNYRWHWWEILGWRVVGYCWVAVWWMEVLPTAGLSVMRCRRAGRYY